MQNDGDIRNQHEEVHINLYVLSKNIFHRKFTIGEYRAIHSPMRAEGE